MLQALRLILVVLVFLEGQDFLDLLFHLAVQPYRLVQALHEIRRFQVDQRVHDHLCHHEFLALRRPLVHLFLLFRRVDLVYRVPRDCQEVLEGLEQFGLLVARLLGLEVLEYLELPEVLLNQELHDHLDLL